MKHCLIAIISTFLAFTAVSQENFNVELLSFTEFTEGGSDIWGWVDEDGNEYAIVGSTNATRIFSLTDPTNPVEVAVIPGSSSLWRDIKSWGNFLYVTADSGNDGLLIIDMTNAPEEITHAFWQPEIEMAGEIGVLRQCHNIYVDENGFAYLAGCRIPSDRDRRGIIMLDLKIDPWIPTVVGTETNQYAHDVYTRGDTMYTSDIYLGEFSMYDVSDKANPVYLGGAETSSQFCHNAWISKDGKTLFTTDELPDAFVDAYDISDVNNIRRLDIYQPEETVNEGLIPHNTHVYGDDFLVTSWYSDGVVITDASRPDNMVKVGSFDTYLGPTGGYNGCWGAYPWLPSGLLLVSNITNGPGNNNGGLYVLRPNYVNASFLEGTVVEEGTGTAINMANVSVQNPTNTSTNSDPGGVFKTGISDTGLYDVVISHPDYQAKTESVFFANGEVKMLDVELERKVAASISGSVVKSADGTAVAGADVIIYNDDNSFEVKADDEGNFTVELFEGDYTALAGAWGYFHKSQDIAVNGSEEIELTLDRGYQDDFIFDHLWTVSSDAPRGIWEKGEPNGTVFNGSLSNPDEDYADDFGIEAYVTGNAGGGAGEDDVDNGETLLSSPAMDLSGYTDPNFHFSYWFVNASGNNAPNDSLTISISNGIEDVRILVHTDSAPEWLRMQDFSIAGLIDLTDKMNISVLATDRMGSGNLVEGGFDAFLVTEGKLTSTEEQTLLAFDISPNPFSDYININWEGSASKAVLFDNNGRKMQSFEINTGVNKIEITEDYLPGIYHLQITDQDNRQRISKLIKI